MHINYYCHASQGSRASRTHTHTFAGALSWVHTHTYAHNPYAHTHMNIYNIIYICIWCVCSIHGIYIYINCIINNNASA